MAEWLKAHAWKVCKRQRFEGSNPSLSANSWIRTLEIYQAVRQATVSRAERRSQDGGYKNAYFKTGSPFLRAALKKLLLTRSVDSFCINESISTGLDTAGLDAVVGNFLQAYYPDKCEYEK